MIKRYVRITNTSNIPICKDWITPFLTDEEMERYQAFKESPEYLGMDDQQRSIRSRIPEAVKARPFYNRLRKGVLVKNFEMKASGMSDSVPTYKWALAPNREKLLNESDHYHVQRICVEYDIPFNTSDSHEVLVDKIMDFFGSSEVILREDNYERSGLSRYQKRTIGTKFLPGEAKPTIYTEGLLDVEVVPFNPESIPQSGEVVSGKLEGEKESADMYSAYKLGRMTKSALEKIAKEMGIDINTTKDQIINEILAKQ